MKGARISVDRGGLLQVEGSAQAPAIFTSASDDSVGGDTNGDGSATSAADGLSGALIFQDCGGRVSISHALLENAYTALSQNGSCGNQPLSISDSELRTPLDLLGGGGSRPVITRDTFAVDTSHASSALRLYGEDPSGIDLAGPNRNSFTGPPQAHLLSFANVAQLPSGASWTLSSEGGAIVEGYLSVGGDLTVAAGAIVKGARISVDRGGLLQVEGSAQAPAIFTSASDDSVGGDTNGDGASSALEVGSSTAISLSPDATLQATGLAVRYAGTALDMSGGTAALNDVSFSNDALGLNVRDGNASVRGRIRNLANGVRACNWGGSCTVDAAYVDWGTSEGPFPAGRTPLVCGAVTVDPWVGGSADGGGFVENCDGSPPPSAAVTGAASNFSARVSQACGGLGTDVCDAARTAYNCLSAGVDLANQASPFPFPTLESGAQHLGEAAVSAGTDYLKGSESAGVATGGEVLAFAHKVIGVVGTFFSLADAYNRCAP